MKSSPQNQCDFRFVFPEFLMQLKYQHQVKPTDLESVELLDCREIFKWYLKEMTRGVQYERELNQPWNTSSLNHLTKQNFQNARDIGSLGWSYEGIDSLLINPMPELESIPPWVDLLETKHYDAALVKLVFALYGHRGIQIANACKILYQKRPRLVPILDQYARQAFNIPWIPDNGDADPQPAKEPDDVMTLASRQIRRVADHGSNCDTLSRLSIWLRESSDATGFPPISKLRVLDILAWGVAWRREKGIR
jgi:hypothetical protein